MSQCFTLGDVTTVNMTMVKGGVAYNVIPAEMEVSFDLRIPPTVNLQVCRLHSLYFNRIVLCLYYFIALLHYYQLLFFLKNVSISNMIWSKVV